MQTRFSISSRDRKAAQAFSLVELLTAVSIMVVIVFALTAMFNQTQKALRSNLTQVDVLESGRTAAEMLGREMEQMSACSLPGTINFYVGFPPAAVAPPPVVQMDTASQGTVAPVLRTNLLEEVFFLSRQTNNWVATGYRVMQAPEGVGTLYRYSVLTNYYNLNSTNLISQFQRAELVNPVTKLLSTNFSRVADGVIHFRMTSFDPAGRRLGWETTNLYSGYRILRFNRTGTKLGLYSSANTVNDAHVILRQSPLNYSAAAMETQFTFMSNALPGYVELEIGVLESSAYKQYLSLRDSPASVQKAFLAKQASKVHLFRQRIPIRTGLQ